MEGIGYLKEVKFGGRIGRIYPANEVKPMVIRLKLRLKSIVSKEVVVIALVNTGYEAVRPELLIPAMTTHDLGLYPTLPQGSEIREYVLADGSRTRLIKVPDALEVSAITEDGVMGAVKCDSVIAEISGKLANAIQPAALAISEGL